MKCSIKQKGLTSGCGNGNFCPDGCVPRKLMAVILYRAFELN